jgi:phosphatidylglycerophosphate synthase
MAASSSSSDKWIVDGTLGWAIPLLCAANVHPNVITLAALVLSAAIPWLHLHRRYFAVVICLLGRQVFDCLDGTVARQCNKTSTLGGYLDSLADVVGFYGVVFIVWYTLTGRQLVKSLVGAGVTQAALCLMLCVVFGSDWMHDHGLLKDPKEKSWFKSVIAFAVDNSLLVTLAFSLAYLAYFHSFSAKRVK